MAAEGAILREMARALRMLATAIEKWAAAKDGGSS
jgi:hypothetical protein